MNHVSPIVAIIDPNTLAAIGLRMLLQSVVPIMSVDVFGSYSELQANHPERYVHYFVATNIVVAHRQFFLEHKRKTIVLSMSVDPNGQLPEFHSICVNVPEKQLVRSLLRLQQSAHANGRNMPAEAIAGAGGHPHASGEPTLAASSPLSNREIEVLALIVQGYLNKEIAHRLNIALSTVVSHRKNIMDKLGMRSVGALTIYAVMHGYVDINSI